MKTLNSRFFIWLLLALPLVPMVAAVASGTPGPNGQPVTEMLLHPTGEFAARFMIAAMIVSPLRLIFPASHALKWLSARRRYLGVAAFSYALAHTALYVVDMQTVAAILAEFWALGIWTGWVAFLLFIPLAATSNEWAVRRLGRRWNILQRCIYVAALATLAHWIFVHNNIGPALVHFVPLAALEIYRIWRHFAASNTGKMPV